jgi:hypothetical protein
MGIPYNELSHVAAEMKQCLKYIHSDLNTPRGTLGVTNFLGAIDAKGECKARECSLGNELANSLCAYY